MDRELLSEVYSQVPPEVLYHYTTQAGLLGILESRTIWATHTQYLNDRREYLHALDLARGRLAELKTKHTDEWVQQALVAMVEGLEGVEGMCVCVFSLSEDGDSLSQWRAYSGGVGGVAIGISRETLLEVCKRSALRFGKCVYELGPQKELMAVLVDAALEDALWFRKPGVVDWKGKVREMMAEYMNQYAPLLKDRSFHSEQEWRLISGPIAPHAYDFRFRVGASTIVPYYRVRLDESKERRFSPVKVIVGPTPHAEQAAHAVRLLLWRRKMDECSIKGVVLSEVPYRSW